MSAIFGDLDVLIAFEPWMVFVHDDHDVIRLLAGLDATVQRVVRQCHLFLFLARMCHQGNVAIVLGGKLANCAKH